MDALLTQAALLSGLPDPAPRMAALTAARPGELADLAVELERLHRALALAAQPLRTAAGDVSLGWSDPRPAAAALRLADAVEASGTLVAGLVAASSSAAADVRAAQDRGASAVAAAERQLAGWSPAELTLGTVPGLSPPPPAVTSAVVTVLAELDAAQRAVDGAAARLTGLVDTDPGAPVAALVAVGAAGPAGAGGAGRSGGATGGAPLGPGAATGGTAAAADRDLRARVLADLGSGDPGRAAFAAGVLRALDRAAAGGPAALLVYEPGTFAGQGRVAIAEGDLTTADNVAVLIPGVGNSPAEMSGTIDAAHHLRLAAADEDAGARTAVITWYGYDIPGSAKGDPPVGRSDRAAIDDMYAMLSADRAAAGAEPLARDVGRFAAMAPPGALVTVIGHSMGAVVASQAAATSDLPADGLVLIGSPGAGPGVASAADYRGLDPGRVFVQSDDRDPMTGSLVDTGAPVGRYLLALNTPLGLDPSSSGFGPDPAAASFGATVLAAGSYRPVDDPLALPSTGQLLGTDRHGLAGYVAGPGLVAVAAVITGRYSRVPTRPGRGPR